MYPRRPWYEWSLWAVWLAFEIVVLQAAIGSAQELEPQASTIFSIVFGVCLAGGVIVWFARRRRLKA